MTSSLNNPGSGPGGTYATTAPLLFAAGFSAVPIKPGTKAPPVTNWTGYCDNLPKLETQRELVAKYGEYGVGVCLGREVRQGLRFAAVDIDVEHLRGPIRGLFGQPRSSKRGKKGETFFVLADKGVKSTSLKNAAGQHAIDVLIGGRQTVLPPTIHPETSQPYEWIGETLLEISFDDLPILDLRKFDLLRAVVASEHLATLTNGGTGEDA